MTTRTPRPSRPRRAAVAASAVTTTLSLLVAGCGASEDPGADAPSSPTATDTSDTGALPAVDLPAGPLGDQARWLVGQISAEPVDDEAAIAAHFAQSMLDQVPVAELQAGMSGLRATGPWTPVAVETEDSAAVVTLQDSTGTFLDAQMVVDEAGLIVGLLLTPGSDPTRPAPTTWEELDERVGELGDVDVALLVSRVTAPGAGQAPADRCEPVHSTGETAEAMPVASIFKLYVLAAVVGAVEDGALAWDTPLTLTDDVRSLPSGTLQDQPTGTVVTVREAADAMIAISDNTAADLLVATVGRDAVLAAMAATGIGDPELNTPFLTTRDLFRLGWGDAAPAQGWDSLTEPEQAAAVAALPGGPVAVDPAAVTTPVWEEGLDWFADATDLCAVHVALHDLAASDAGAPVREILSTNPGIEIDADTWPYVAFKGGSTPGALAGAWYAEDAEGRAVVVSVQIASGDPAAMPGLAVFADLAAATLVLAAD